MSSSASPRVTRFQHKPRIILILFLLAKPSLQAEGCLIEYNTDYYGNDIVNKVAETRQACADLCATTPDGLFWTFHTVHKTCFVKSSSSGRKTNQDFWISGNRKCGKIGDQNLLGLFSGIGVLSLLLIGVAVFIYKVKPDMRSIFKCLHMTDVEKSEINIIFKK